MFLFRTIFKYIWPQILKYKGAFWAIIILFSIRTVVDAILIPYYFKNIIDNLSQPDVSRMLISHDLFQIVFIIIGLTLVVGITARSRQFLYFNFVINIVRELRNFAFQKIEKNSQSFFDNTFAGSLVTKSRRFIYAFEIMFDIFVFNFLNFVILLIGVFIVLTKESPTISLEFFVLTMIYLIVISFFVKNKMKY